MQMMCLVMSRTDKGERQGELPLSSQGSNGSGVFGKHMSSSTINKQFSNLMLVATGFIMFYIPGFVGY